MGRANYTSDLESKELNMWRGAVASGIRGRRGQQLLKDLRESLLALPVKKLIAEELETNDGEVCALGAVGKLRKIDMKEIDPDDSETVAGVFNVSDALAREIVYQNDEGAWHDTPEERYTRMLEWCQANIKD